jgi:1,2-diacylglycerol-3-alpha-glucose alpha-1,2-glucosyltransferase
MKINIISDSSVFFKKEVGGVTSAVKHHTEILEKIGVNYSINQFNFKEDYDIVHSHTWFLIALAKRIVTKKPVVVSVHNIPEEAYGTSGLPPLILNPLVKYAISFYKSADVLVAPSEFTKKTIKKYGFKKQIEVISNGVNVNKFKPNNKKRNSFRKKWNINKDKIIVYNVADIISRKGVTDFLKIAKKMTKHRFFWAGKQNFSPLIKDGKKIIKAARNEGKNVNFPGYVKDVLEVHNGGDIFLFPSFVENQGISLLEAMSCGKPPIIRNIEVYKGWMEHGKNCLKAKNNKEFIENIELLTSDEKLRKRIGRNARKTALKHSYEKVGKKYLKLYKKLV